MFDAKAARELTEGSNEIPLVLLQLKEAVLAAAQAGLFAATVPLPRLIETPDVGTGPASLAELMSAMREQGLFAWAKSVSHCNSAGYSVSVTRGIAGQLCTSAPAVDALVLKWLSPKQVAEGCLFMSADVAHQIAERAQTMLDWAAPVLAQVAEVAGAGRRMHLVANQLNAQDKAWDAKLAHLEKLGFAAEVLPEGSRSTLSLAW